LVIRTQKKKNLTEEEQARSEADAQFAAQRGDRWTFVAVLPRSSFVYAIHHNKRTVVEAERFIKKIKQRSDGQAPLFLSDAWFYEEALFNTYCRYEPVPYKGRGRRPHPKRVVDEKLMYAQVYKKRDSKGKILEIQTRIIKGDEQKILEIIQLTSRAKVINTSYVESRNGKYRKDDARLNRDTACHSKKPKYHDAHIDWLTAVFNYCQKNYALKQVINPNARRFEQKYKHYSPAMAEGLTDKILTIKELLCWRPIKESP
jgi:hypothetical protein